MLFSLKNKYILIWHTLDLVGRIRVDIKEGREWGIAFDGRGLPLSLILEEVILFKLFIEPILSTFRRSV